MFTDCLLVCRDCQQEFVFTVEEQVFYESRGLTNTPTHCPACRAARRGQAADHPWSSGERAHVRGERPMYAAICASCGRETQVPFQQQGDRPVYCPDCYQEHRNVHRSRWSSR